MILQKVSRRLDKMPSYLRNFILHEDLWPYLGKKNKDLAPFSIASIEGDISGKMISEWQRNVVNKHLAKHNALLSYDRPSGKQILYFLSEYEKYHFDNCKYKE